MTAMLERTEGRAAVGTDTRAQAGALGGAQSAAQAQVKAHGVTAGGDLHGRAVDRLGCEIVSGRWAPGRVFRTEDLAGDMGVSLSVMREAVRVAESLGLLTSRKRVGVRVLPEAHWLALDPRVLRWQVGHDTDDASAQRLRTSLVSILLGLTPSAAAAAAQLSRAEDIASISAAAVALAAAPDTAELACLVLAVVDAAHDPLFSAVADSMRSVDAWNVVARNSAIDASIDAAAAVALAVAVKRGDAGAAHIAMRDLVAPLQNAWYAAGRST